MDWTSQTTVLAVTAQAAHLSFPLGQSRILRMLHGRIRDSQQAAEALNCIFSTFYKKGLRLVSDVLSAYLSVSTGSKEKR